MTDKEIIKGLKDSIERCCIASPLLNVQFNREDNLLQYAIDLINRQQAEIEQYKARVLNDTEYIEKIEVQNRKQQAEIERLQEKYNRTMTGLKAVLDERADHTEAIKEFAELVDKDIEEKLSDSIKEQNPHLYLIHQIVKDRLKEMVGDGVTECQKKTRYIVVHENWLFESYLCESCFGWDVYQFEKTENDYKLRLHMLAEEPVATVEDAKEYVERWQKANEIADTVDGEKLVTDIVGLINKNKDDAE